ncbi:MAG: GFA family protein [Gammaproteobacteria bacterium]|jgi:hypothetical protein
MTATGKCLCGAVTFKAEDVDPHVHGCHCSMCRNWSGGPMLAVQVGRVEFTGEDTIRRYQSSAWAERGFCGECGSNLFYRLKDTDRYIMCTGAFDDQTPFELVGEIYVDEKPPGYNFAGDHPRQTGEEFMASLQQT